MSSSGGQLIRFDDNIIFIIFTSGYTLHFSTCSCSAHGHQAPSSSTSAKRHKNIHIYWFNFIRESTKRCRAVECVLPFAAAHAPRVTASINWELHSNVFFMIMLFHSFSRTDIERRASNIVITICVSSYSLLLSDSIPFDRFESHFRIFDYIFSFFCCWKT